MHIIGVVVAVGGVGWVLWLWLIGHWFGRVLAFLLFGPLSGFLCSALASVAMDRAGAPPTGGGGLVMMIVGIGLGIGWCIASIPIWVAQSKERRYHEELARNVATY